MQRRPVFLLALVCFLAFIACFPVKAQEYLRVQAFWTNEDCDGSPVYVGTDGITCDPSDSEYQDPECGEATEGYYSTDYCLTEVKNDNLVDGLVAVEAHFGSSCEEDPTTYLFFQSGKCFPGGHMGYMSAQCESGQGEFAFNCNSDCSACDTLVTGNEGDCLELNEDNFVQITCPSHSSGSELDIVWDNNECNGDMIFAQYQPGKTCNPDEAEYVDPGCEPIPDKDFYSKTECTTDGELEEKFEGLSNLGVYFPT